MALGQACIAPPQSFERFKRREAWRKFHKNLMQKDPESLDKVINLIDHIIKLATGQEDSARREEYFQETVYGSNYVTGHEIGKHFTNYVNSRLRESEITDYDEIIRYQWNVTHNILRCLKRIRHDEAPFQLSYKDIKHTEEFMDKLQFAATIK